MDSSHQPLKGKQTGWKKEDFWRRSYSDRYLVLRESRYQLSANFDVIQLKMPGMFFCTTSYTNI
jgi:hypothetical protein